MAALEAPRPCSPPIQELSDTTAWSNPQPPHPSPRWREISCWTSLARFHQERGQPQVMRTSIPSPWFNADFLKVFCGHPAKTRRSWGLTDCPAPHSRGAGWIVSLGVGQNPTRACHGLLNGPSPWGLQVWWCGDWTPHPLLYH